MGFSGVYSAKKKKKMVNIQFKKPSGAGLLEPNKGFKYKMSVQLNPDILNF